MTTKDKPIAGGELLKFEVCVTMFIMAKNDQDAHSEAERLVGSESLVEDYGDVEGMCDFFINGVSEALD